MKDKDIDEYDDVICLHNVMFYFDKKTSSIPMIFNHSSKYIGDKIYQLSNRKKYQKRRFFIY